MSRPDEFYQKLRQQTQELRDAGLYKAERIITSAQGAIVRLQDGRDVLNLCATTTWAYPPTRASRRRRTKRCGPTDTA